MGELTGKVAIVAGASKGIGAAIARAFAKAGSGRLLVIPRFEQSRRHLLIGWWAEIVKAGGKRRVAIQADVAKRARRAAICFAEAMEARPAQHPRQ